MAETPASVEVLPAGPGPVPDSIFELLYTARTVRRLHPDPVPQELLSRLVEVATMAPTDSNSQRWRFIVVTDRALMQELGRLNSIAFENHKARAEAKLSPAVFASVGTLGNGLGDSPALIVVGGIDAPSGEAPVSAYRTFYGGIWPAIQNIILGARALGLGATPTTMLLHGAEREVHTLLGIPDEVLLVAAIPVGFPRGKHGRPPRDAVDAVAHLNNWGTPLPPPEGTAAIPPPP